MAIFDSIYSYLMYLIHPSKGHAVLSGEVPEEQSDIKKLSLYEALGISWLFLLFNGLVRILLINWVIIMFFNFTDMEDGLLAQFIQTDNLSGFYFVVLSTILDVIFYPLLTLIIVHFWEYIIKVYGRLLGVPGDLSLKARNVMTVSLSSNLLMVIPILGDLAQKLAQLFLMFVGLRKQFGVSFALGVCILMTPFLLFLGFFSVILMFVILSML